MLEMEGLGFRNPRGDKSIALVGDAETALQRGSVGVLDISRTPNDKRILAIVDCFCERIADLEKHTLARLPLQREIQSGVDAARSAFVGVNGSQPRYRPLYVVNAGRIRAGHRGGGLPGGEGCNRSEEHTSELQSRQYLVCRLLLEKKKQKRKRGTIDRWLSTAGLRLCLVYSTSCSLT